MKFSSIDINSIIARTKIPISLTQSADRPICLQEQACLPGSFLKKTSWPIIVVDIALVGGKVKCCQI